MYIKDLLGFSHVICRRPISICNQQFAMEGNPHLTPIQCDRHRSYRHVHFRDELAAACSSCEVPHANIAILIPRNELILPCVEGYRCDLAAGLELALAPSSPHVPDLDSLVFRACSITLQRYLQVLSQYVWKWAENCTATPFCL
jgi:hypothetical protein